jgi:hypothetical protein
VAADYSIKRIDEFETMEGSGGCTWRLARKTLGAEAFGFNVVDIEPGGEMPAHDHTGDDHPAPAGTFARYAPPANRTIRNKSDAPVRALVIGVPMDSGYTGMGWG